VWLEADLSKSNIYLKKLESRIIASQRAACSIAATQQTLLRQALHLLSDDAIL
jgi:hypothetical protein